VHAPTHATHHAARRAAAALCGLQRAQLLPQRARVCLVACGRLVRRRQGRLHASKVALPALKVRLARGSQRLRRCVHEGMRGAQLA
jgi:hypothetical protein